MDEDLNKNLFFQTIKFKFPKIFQLIESKCYTLCIPQFSSLYGMNVSQKVVESHVFIESKYYQSEYETLCDDSSYFVENGFIVDKNNKSKKVKILFDEICYNKDYKSYRLLCIEAPLVGGTGIKPSISHEEFDHFQGIVKPQRPTFEQSIQFLLDSPASINSIVMRKADKLIEDFQNTWKIIKGRETDLKESLEILHEKVLNDLVCANAEYKQLQSNHKQMLNLSMILESYILGRLYDKIYKELLNQYELENMQLYEKTIKLSKHSIEDLGIRASFEPHLSKAIEIVNSFEKEKTPIDKLLSIVQASKEIEESIRARSILEGTEEEDILTITGDDALPITAYLLIQARPKSLQTDLIYCSHFIISSISNSSLGYHLVNFTAAIDYIKRLYQEFVEKQLEDNTISTSTTSPTSSTTNLTSSLSFSDISISDNNSNNNNNNNNFVDNNSLRNNLNDINNNSSSSSTIRKNSNPIQPNLNKFNQYNSTPNLHYQSTISSPLKPIIGHTENAHKYNTLTSNSNAPNNRSTLTSNYVYTKAPTVIDLNDDESGLGEFIGKLKDIKEDVVVGSYYVPSK
ncbi:hypothetical protein CYY_003504 [Polysphondylium violaceum]|uniref:VPS9 domain-containing protein n=1 Tax=Polysphondylium violaceum TaxID=133409 RepID=A0A8J4PYC3_9MYCE|nr:hypothetical protein CYY_003504 [Polysphondylium violaceum]